MSLVQLVAGGVLWGIVLIVVARSVLMQQPDAAESGVTNSSAADETDTANQSTPAAEPVVLTPGASSVRVSFPARELPEFEFPECLGGTVSRENLKGQPWVASFVFTRCVETCPTITKAIMELHLKVAESNPKVRFVSFSVDSSYDTADVLKQYAEVFRADHDRWKFVTGDELEIHTLIGKGFAQYVKPNIGEMRKPGFEVAHSNRCVLVNSESIPVATFLATKAEDMVKLRRILEGKDEFPQPGPAAVVSAGDGTAQPAVSFQIQRVPSADDEVSASDADEASARPKNDEEQSPSQLPAPILAETKTSSADSPVEPTTNEKIDQLLPSWAKLLPHVNATLNGICTILLVAGLRAIKRSHKMIHRNLMLTAFGFSTVFLASYLTYHYALGEYTGERGRRFIGSDIAALVYRSILIPHVILAVFVPILAIQVFRHAFAGRWDQHRRLARITFPIWLFVSVTGVVIYAMLYQWPWRPA